MLYSVRDSNGNVVTIVQDEKEAKDIVKKAKEGKKEYSYKIIKKFWI